ncbi:MAG: hypothetical protein CMH75_02985 [Nitrospina sp.]|nr:hypothetical protein [Nitrospina sp.]|tara:strand:- start:1644 stop:2423 length:780 start_codon:yes stop_codon:yes gene_type:complete
MLRTNFTFGLISFVFLLIISISHASEVNSIPELSKILIKIRSLDDKSQLQEKEYLIKKFYYQIQYQKQKLDILSEVKGHFEKSISKAEEKYDEGEDNISQTDITKLKLGLAGTLNDIFEAETGLKTSKLSLSEILDTNYGINSKMFSPKIIPVKFEFNNYEEWSLQNKVISNIHKRVILLKKSFLKVTEKKNKMVLARKNRKMTRALLVSEVANYDFGIGDPNDLFQALIIYTRVLSGYYESVYKYNLAVAELNRNKNI